MSQGMTINVQSLLDELNSYSSNIQGYLSAEQKYAEDPSNPAPDFVDFFPTFKYVDLHSSSVVASRLNYTYNWATIVDSMKRIEAMDRETDLVKRTKAQYYATASKSFKTDTAYEAKKTTEQSFQISGT